MTSDSVAQNLLLHRLRLGLTQEQLAERAGVTARTIQRIEATGAAHLTTLTLLATALAIPVQALQTPAPTPKSPAPTPVSADRHALVLLQLLPLLGAVVPFANVLAPLFYWLHRRSDDPVFAAQARLVVNFQLSVTVGIGAAVGLLLSYFPAGLGLLMLCSAGALALSLVNARRAWRGVRVRYPLALPALSSGPKVGSPA
ncbi:helix-turn-helix domain-containing protein [Hymenobacter cellulosilyticus]|uniref:Helix-turn-helix domain-containing protein n=1 Tax=Hymenobacter cellulosilyticus TaxID=2932248 RepID=A0A8T9Q1S2_9BACT|nr:helix-turn-helix domain-containing protein [Hymenobacter cellulosilyticus]UOQ70391.1 helix-turn-helix domain-containing protein [Hymenobacter cellulosilyticus]